ncbi:RDD family protein [Luteococcus sp. H138]|uniref:RDD family protein n=1 Tax=unclassified Luteococcus TaxID=2639923 RepID=UPI00313DC041
MTTPVAGWYADPTGQAPLRWWDGATWSGYVTGWADRAASWRLAGWWERARGYLMDAGLLWLASLFLLERWHTPFINEVVGILRVSILTDGGRLPGPVLWWDYGLVQLWLLTAIPGIILRVGYDLLCLVWQGATIGHRRVGLRVVAAAEDPQTATGHGLVWHRALRRSLVLRILAPTCLGWLVCVLWPLADSQRRSLADLVAGTLVVARDDERPLFPLGEPGVARQTRG